MKIHYINILLFALPLNILVHNQRNLKSTTPHTQKIPTNRSLCECELYAPANYDNDPQMKAVMKDFDLQSSQRFQEYNERMIKNRQKCKEQCDKEIQKIILKDKLEKQMEEELTTLETKIDANDIPTCICEKSLADKVEKGCLRCAQNLGGIVAPSSGVLTGIAEAAVIVWKPTALHLAMRAAMVEGATKGLAAGLKAGKDVVISALQNFEVHNYFPKIFNSIVTEIPFYDVGQIAGAIIKGRDNICALGGTGVNPKCTQFDIRFVLMDSRTLKPYGDQSTEITKIINTFVENAKGPAATEAAGVTTSETATLTEAKVGAVESTYGSFQTAITASIIAIVVIILIMVIIYLILRHRRKKKMKKKLEYIKLLEE